MEILFISDFNLSHTSGGAQVSNDLIIKAGEGIGHNITLHNYDSGYEDFTRSYDLVVSSNLEAISRTSPGKLNYIFNHPNHVRLEHDSCLYLDKETREKLFNSSKINFFLSEFHISYFKQMYGDIFGKVEIVPDPIDTNIFKIGNQDKIYDIVYCGFLHELKGLKNLLQFSKDNPERKIDIFGWGYYDFNALSKDFQNITFRGKIEHSDTVNVYQRSKGVFHSPIVNEPFCRMVAEAILCGVEEFHGNRNKIGSIQEFQRLGRESFSQNCMNAAQIFWSKIPNKS